MLLLLKFRIKIFKLSKSLKIQQISSNFEISYFKGFPIIFIDKKFNNLNL